MELADAIQEALTIIRWFGVEVYPTHWNRIQRIDLQESRRTLQLKILGRT